MSHLFLAVAALAALYGLIGFLVVPPIARKLIAERLGERLGRVVVVDRISLNPYTLDARVDGLRILEPDGKAVFASFDSLDVNASIASAWQLAPVVDELTLSGLRVRVVRDGESHYNLSDILARLAPKARAARPDESREEPARFSLGNIRVLNAAVDFDDRPQHATHRVSEIQVAIPFVSNLPVHLKDPVQPSFSANADGSPLRLTGEALPFENTVRTHFNLALQGLDLPRYLGYVPGALPAQVDSGKLDANITLRFTQVPGRQPAIDVTGKIALADLSLSTADGPLARLARLEADVASLDPLGGRVTVSALRLAGASAMQERWKVAGARAAAIEIDLAKQDVRVASLETEGGELALVRGRDGALAMPRLPSSDHPAHWDIALARASVSDYKVSLTDDSVKPAATQRLVLTSLEATDLATRDGLTGQAQIKARLDHGGALDASATFALDPLRVEAKLDARSIDLVPLRPYAAQFSTVTLKSGAASAHGTLGLSTKGNGLRVGYSGSAQVTRLATLDTLSKEELLDWKSVRAGGIRLEYATDAPLDLAVGEVLVEQAYSRVVVTPEGKLNVQQLRMATAEEPAPGAPAEPPRPRNVRIDRITFADSRLDFSDHYIKPNYSADVAELQGSVTGLSSDPASRGAVDLKGRWDASSPVVIAGTVNPLRGDLFLDIAAKGNDIELPKLTAYSQRYAGYGITAGRLTLDVKYHIENGKMEGRNKIVIDQLTFGDRVESPEATKLPVLFAVNLLKDADGRIDLELPISGSLDDPQFQVGALVGQVFGSLLKKAVSSPFSLLAAATGGAEGNGEGLAFVEFAPGSAALGEAGGRKVDQLAKALRGRPGLKLELSARYDEAGDAEALKAAMLRERMASAPKDISKEAREKLAAEPVAIPPTQLQALAAARGEAVKAKLVGEGRLAPDRVVLAAAPPEETRGASSRVEFALR